MEIFPLIHGGRSIPRRHSSPPKSLVLPHEKTRRSFAFGSSQRNRMTLMFGAGRFWRPGLSASRSFRFRITPRGTRVAPRRLMLHKRFKQQRILECARPRVASFGSSA
jgi:hypothetical protein